MATSSPKPFMNRKKSNFDRFSGIITLYTRILSDILYSEHPIPDNVKNTILASADLSRKLYTPVNKKTIDSFKSARNYEECDITLLCSLIRHTCTKLNPTSGWGLKELPLDAYVEVGDDIERIRISRNDVFAHTAIKELENQRYKKYYRIAREICKRLKQYSQGRDYEDDLQQIHESHIEDVKGVGKKIDKLAGKYTYICK